MFFEESGSVSRVEKRNLAPPASHRPADSACGDDTRAVSGPDETDISPLSVLFLTQFEFLLNTLTVPHLRKRGSSPEK